MRYFRTPNWIVSSWPPETAEILAWQWREKLVPYWHELAALAKENVLCGATSKHKIRMVTHYDVDRAGIDRTIAAFAELCQPT